MKPIDIIYAVIWIIGTLMIWVNSNLTGEITYLGWRITGTVVLVVIAWLYIACSRAKEMPDNFK